jgi:WD40 repeat protein
VADVFISYSKSRRTETVELAAALEARGFTVWWDKELTPGETFGATIREELTKARAAIVIWTPAAVKSNWVIAEATYAYQRNVLIAVQSADLNPHDIPFPFGVVHTEPVENRTAIFAALAKLGVEPSGTPAKTGEDAGPPAAAIVTPVAQRAWLPSRRAMLAGAGAIAVGAGAAVVWFRPQGNARPAGPLHTLQANQAVSALAYTTNSRNVVSGGWDQKLTLWDPTRAEVIRRFDGHVGVVWCVAMLPDGAHALSGGDDATLKLWQLESTRPVREFKEHQKEIYSVAILPNGRGALSASLDGTLKLWDLASEHATRTFSYGSPILAVAVSPDGQTAISAAKDVLQAWSVADAGKLRRFPDDGRNGHVGDVNAVAIAANGRHVISGGDDGTVKLWDFASGHELNTFAGPDGHAGKVFAVAVSRNSRTALSGGADKTARLWELASGKLIAKFEGHAQSVETVAIAPDGSTAVTGSRDRTIKVWDLSGTGAAA